MVGPLECGNEPSSYIKCGEGLYSMALAIFVMSVRLSTCISAAPSGGISAKFDTGGLLRKSIKKTKIWLKSGSVRESLHVFYCCRWHPIARGALSLNQIASRSYDYR